MKKIRGIFLLLFVLLPLSGEVIKARQKFFSTVEKDPAAAVLYLKDKDPEIRRYAYYCVFKKNGTAELQLIKNAVSDPDENISRMAVLYLIDRASKEKKLVTLLEEIAQKNPVSAIRCLALQASWPFHREIKLLRNDPTWDYEVKTIKSFSLVPFPWLFRTDPKQKGHLQGFFKPDHNVSRWKKIRMGVWEKQGYPGYDGVAWYQIKFKMPPKMECNAVEIAFEGVDESAWVWLNGIYLGAHDIGPGGWNKPFAVDCRKEIRWGGENVLTVRVYDAAFSGGIYKPVRVDILK